MKYVIKYGLGGGFGGANEVEIIECDTQEQADNEAYQAACEYYDQFDGMHGLRSVQDIMEEDELSEEEAEETWREERETWLDYYSEPFNEETHKDLID